MKTIWTALVFTGVVCIATASSPSIAQEQACTEMGCESGVIFNLDHDRQWKPGNYVFYATMDMKTYACKGELPLKPCAEGASFICSSPLLSISESGCALPKEEHGLTQIKLDGKPQKVIIRMTYQGEPLFTKTLHPRYDMSQPNGPACGPVCYTATYRLLVAE